jgi:hypothetical protein
LALGVVLWSTGHIPIYRLIVYAFFGGWLFLAGSS